MYLQLTDLTKRYGTREVVSNLNLEVSKGQICCLLGASGCGKTTTLRMVGGYLPPTSGRILLDGQDITALPPEDRQVSTVFQNYALFPHMTVAENVAYGLKCRGVPAAERKTRTNEMLAAVRLEGYGDAHIHEISGGQQQRAALARSLVLRPKLLLLDEPLSNLDAALRLEMRAEIRRIQRDFDLTMLFVTHDQEEAMALGDQVAVMHDGHILQKGTPQEVYFNPISKYCAYFLGHLNTLQTPAGALYFREEDGLPDPQGSWKGTVTDSAFLGAQRSYLLDVDGQSVQLRCRNDFAFERGQQIAFTIVRTIDWERRTT